MLLHTVKRDSEVVIKLEIWRWEGDPGRSDRPPIVTKVLTRSSKSINNVAVATEAGVMQP